MPTPTKFHPGWSEDLFEEFVDLWLEDWFLRSPNEPGLVAQMDEFCGHEWGVDAHTFTLALVADLTARGGVLGID